MSLYGLRMGGTRPARDHYTVAIAPPRPGTFLAAFPLPQAFESLPNARHGGGRHVIYLADVQVPWSRPGRRDRDKIRVVLPGDGRTDPSAVVPFSFSSSSFLHGPRPRPSVLGPLRPPDPANAPGLASRSPRPRDAAAPRLRTLSLATHALHMRFSAGVFLPSLPFH